MVTIIRNYGVDFSNEVDGMKDNLSLSVGNTIEFGSTWVHVLGKNAKQETMTIEIVHCENPGGKNSLPYAWHKNGWTDKVMETYVGCHTYVHDSENGCYGGYNVTEKFDGKRNVINFDWLFEDTEENRKKIIEACIELFEHLSLIHI